MKKEELKKIEKKDLLTIGLKSVLGNIPFAGSFFNEVVDFIPNIKQKRLNKFTELLIEYFEKNQKESFDNLKTENFADIFQSTLALVLKTQSERKIGYFKDILIKEIELPSSNIHRVEIYLNLISTLSEQEILILSEFRVFNKDYEIKQQNFYNVKNEYTRVRTTSDKTIKYIGRGKMVETFKEAKNYIEINEKYFENLNLIQNHKYHNLLKRDFLFYKQSLFSKGLLVEENQGLVFGGVEPFSKMLITEFGEDFINFIVQSEKTVGNTV